MRIKRLDIEGFKVFEKTDIHFSENQTTAFIGNNGSGKTSILEALRIIMEIVKDNILREHGGITDIDINLINNKCEKAIFNLYLILSQSINQKDKISNFYFTKKRKTPDVNGYGGFNESFLELKDFGKKALSDPTTNISTIIYYPTDRIVEEIDLEADELDNHPFTAYDNALDASVNFNGFFKWFRNMEDLENEVRLNEDVHHRNKSLTSIRTAIESFLPNFSHLRVKRKGQAAMVVKKGEEELEVNQLSHGEKVLLAMVGDIARRLSIANPSLEHPLEGEGVVMIDEIELHLHPTWQRMVIDNLEATFPNLQFIVTTHSPQVVGNLEKGSVFSVENGKVYPLPYSYGRDSNWILKVMMNANEIEEEVAQDLEHYFGLIEAGRLEEASAMRLKLEQEIGEDYPPFVKADILTRRKQKLLR